MTFIKLDVEGAELDVFRGSEEILSRNNRLFLAIATYHYPGEVFEVAKFLKVKGFKVFQMVYLLMPFNLICVYIHCLGVNRCL